MGFFNQGGADLMEVTLQQLLIAYLALHRIVPILPTVKAAHTDITFKSNQRNMYVCMYKNEYIYKYTYTLSVFQTC